MYVDEVEQLRDAGLAPEQLARQLGVTVSALARGLYRANRPDLARPFERARQAARRATVTANTGRKG